MDTKMIEAIGGLAELLGDSEKVERLLQDSSDGRLWAYSDVSIVFRDEWMKQAVERFNQGDKTAFTDCDEPMNFHRAGSTYEAVNKGISQMKSGGRIVELDPELQKVVAVYRRNQREPFYIALEYRQER